MLLVIVDGADSEKNTDHGTTQAFKNVAGSASSQDWAVKYAIAPPVYAEKAASVAPQDAPEDVPSVFGKASAQVILGVQLHR